MLIDGFFRRGPTKRYRSTYSRLDQQYRQDGAAYETILDVDPFSDMRQASEQSLREPFLPALLQNDRGILGIRFGDHMTLDTQFISLLAKTKLGHTLLKRLSNAKRSFEFGILSIPSDASIGSPQRYGLARVGGALPPDLMSKKDAQIVNITADIAA